MDFEGKTMAELRDECILLAKKAENLASRISARIRHRALHEMQLRYPKLSDAELDMRATEVHNEWRSKDPLWRSAVSDNQWYIGQATMFGTAALADEITQIRNTLVMIMNANRDKNLHAGQTVRGVNIL